MAYQAVPIRGFLGLNEDKNPHGLKAEELTIAKNVARRSTNLVGTRPGCVALDSGEDYEDAIRSAAAIQGAIEYRKDFDEGRALIVVADLPGAGTFPNSKISYEDDARLDDATTPVITAGANNKWTFAIHNNVLWAAGGAAADDIWTWDGDSTTPSAPVVAALTDKASGSRLRPKYVKAWRGYLLLNGLRGGTSNTNNPALSRYQDFGTDPTVDANWPDGNSLGFSARQVGVDTFGGAFSTGFGTYHDNDGDFLLVLANNQIASFVRDASGLGDFVRNDIISTGCVDQAAFVDLGPDARDAVYMSPSGHIHSLRQSQAHGDRESAFLSSKIRTTIDSLNPSRIDKTVAAYDRRNGRVVFAMSTGSSTEHNILMALDVRFPESLTSRDAMWYGPWVIGDDGTVKINHLLEARDANGQFYLYAFTTAGRVLRFDEDVFHDVTDTAYEVILRTKHESYESVSSEKRLGDTVISLAPGGSYSIQMQTEYDYGRRVSSPISLNQPNTGAVTLPLTLPFTLSPGEIQSDVKAYTTGRGRTSIAARRMREPTTAPTRR